MLFNVRWRRSRDAGEGVGLFNARIYFPRLTARAMLTRALAERFRSCVGTEAHALARHELQLHPR